MMDMVSPTVIEIPPRTSAVEHDPFIDDLCLAAVVQLPVAPRPEQPLAAAA